jgi:hypothetical protein
LQVKIVSFRYAEADLVASIRPVDPGKWIFVLTIFGCKILLLPQIASANFARAVRKHEFFIPFSKTGRKFFLAEVLV